MTVLLKDSTLESFSIFCASKHVFSKSISSRELLQESTGTTQIDPIIFINHLKNVLSEKAEHLSNIIKKF